MIPLSWVLALAGLLFGIGLLGALLSTNAVRMLICIELMLNAVNINLVAFSRYQGQAHGEIVALFAMAIGAAEAAVGLAIFVAVARNSKVIDIDKINLLKW